MVHTQDMTRLSSLFAFAGALLISRSAAADPADPAVYLGQTGVVIQVWEVAIPIYEEVSEPMGDLPALQVQVGTEIKRAVRGYISDTYSGSFGQVPDVIARESGYYAGGRTPAGWNCLVTSFGRCVIVDVWIDATTGEIQPWSWVADFFTYTRTHFDQEVLAPAQVWQSSDTGQILINVQDEYGSSSGTSVFADLFFPANPVAPFLDMYSLEQTGRSYPSCDLEIHGSGWDDGPIVPWENDGGVAHSLVAFDHGVYYPATDIYENPRFAGATGVHHRCSAVFTNGDMEALHEAP